MNSRWKSHARKTIKWLGTIASAILLTIWIGSGLHPRVAWSGSRNAIFISQGRLWVRTWFTDTSKLFIDAWVSNPPPRSFKDFRLDLNFHRSGPIDSTFFESGIAIPLWFPLLLTALPTTYLWRQDTLATRRTRKNHCPKCNYDRRGINLSAPCPECNSPSP